MITPKTERLPRGWSQAELARRSHLNQNTICLIEAGRFRPYPVQLVKLARALGIPRREAGRLLEPQPADQTKNPHYQADEADHGSTSR